MIAHWACIHHGAKTPCRPREVDPDATWVGFDLALPTHLPPAVEARTIAWRYEIVVRCRPRRGRAETAVRTPLLHEEAALVWAGG